MLSMASGRSVRSQGTLAFAPRPLTTTCGDYVKPGLSGLNDEVSTIASSDEAVGGTLSSPSPEPDKDHPLWRGRLGLLNHRVEGVPGGRVILAARR